MQKRSSEIENRLSKIDNEIEWDDFSSSETHLQIKDAFASRHKKLQQMFSWHYSVVMKHLKLGIIELEGYLPAIKLQKQKIIDMSKHLQCQLNFVLPNLSSISKCPDLCYDSAGQNLRKHFSKVRFWQIYVSSFFRRVLHGEQSDKRLCETIALINTHETYRAQVLHDGIRCASELNKSLQLCTSNVQSCLRRRKSLLSEMPACASDLLLPSRLHLNNTV